MLVHRDTNNPSHFSNLGNSSLTRFRQLGEMADIEQAILNHERAIQLTPDGDPDMPRCLIDLGNSFSTRFEWRGESEDIANAISNLQRAIQLTPEGHRDKPSYLSHHGSALSTRFKHSGDKEDIEQAISNHERAIQLTPDDGHPDQPSRLNNLGDSLLKRFEWLGVIEDIERAISNHESAIQLTPYGHPDKPRRLSNLGGSLLKRFEVLGNIEDIRRAISIHEYANKLTEDGHTDKPRLLSHLGSSFLTRFKVLGDMADVDQAIFNQEQAVQLTPDGHKEKPHRLNCLGNSLSARFSRTGSYDDLAKSIVAYRTSAHLPDGPPSTRLNAAKNWSRLAHDELRHFHPSSQSFLDAYRVAFDLLPRVAWVGLSIDSRRHELQFADTLACDAAAAAISEYDHHLALTWLEQGRSIIWGQILQLRTPIEELRHVYPNLAEELTHISEKLERSTSGDHFTTDQCNESREGALKRHRQLARDWDRIVKEVRQAPGFERFLLPKQFSELRHAARDGIVVVLNVSRYRCDALIIKSPSESFHHVRLEDFSYEKARNLSLSLRHILSDQGIRGHSADRMAYRHLGPGSEPCNDDFRDILAELWELVVRPVIESLESHQTRDEYLRIIWCPTGPLVFLPIHAAGIYNVDGTSSISLPDIAISSYTPTLTALLGNSQRATPNRSMFKLLAVIQPATPGANQLPGTLEELHMIQQHVSNSSMRILAGESATTSAVLSGMEECSWVHLACHGLHDVLHPMESGILLQDGRLKLYKVVQKRLPHAEFAFLSACQTAMGDESLPEEAVHLAAGMLLAGYRGVVATMWAITDNDTPFLAEIFYDRMMSNGQPNGCNGAEALHLAVQELRKRVGSHFLSWVPFVYVGV
ncbi:hypothetical protein BD410DRAFT_733111 [Rickenella mellea]|uniref:CHAT domain-containing protein n=1 Tax=Rickenella mellea TaxID=50990 RepID=A0A4Y7PID4_9AGAM|nr:hypothetical protein BD410DRAFT_733111 [Rickenella mellea]